MKALLKCRVNGWVFIAFTLLYFAVIAVTGFFTSLSIIGYTYSSLTNVTEREDGYADAVYTYTVEGEPHTYTREISAVTSALAPVAETVFYFREYPDTQTEALNIVIYPIFIVILGSAFSGVIKFAQTKLDDKSPRLGEFRAPTVITLVSLIPAVFLTVRTCNLYTSAQSDLVLAKKSVVSGGALLINIGLILLMWGICSKVREYRLKAKDKNTASE